MESTGVYSTAVQRALADAGVEVWVVAPPRLEDLRRLTRLYARTRRMASTLRNMLHRMTPPFCVGLCIAAGVRRPDRWHGPKRRRAGPRVAHRTRRLAGRRRRRRRVVGGSQSPPEHPNRETQKARHLSAFGGPSSGATADYRGSTKNRGNGQVRVEKTCFSRSAREPRRKRRRREIATDREEL